MPSYLVTGANRGLGYGFVQVLARDPANTIFGIVRNKKTADESVKADGLKNVTMIEADITDWKAVIRARDEVSKITGGTLDYLVNNAAYLERNTEANALSDFEDSIEKIEVELVKSFEANVVGIIKTINAFLPLIRKSETKKIVVISSGMADPDLVNGGSIWNGAPYTISKAAVNMAVAKYNARLGSEGILIFALSPGVVKTYGDVEPAALADIRKAMPHWEGPLTPTDSAEMCLKVLHDFSVEKGNGGSFVSHYGNKQWL